MVAGTCLFPSKEDDVFIRVIGRYPVVFKDDRDRAGGTNYHYITTPVNVLLIKVSWTTSKFKGILF